MCSQDFHAALKSMKRTSSQRCYGGKGRLYDATLEESDAELKRVQRLDATDAQGRSRCGETAQGGDGEAQEGRARASGAGKHKKGE